MRSPHYFFWGNLVLRTPTDAWAVYELEGYSYPGLSDSRKIEQVIPNGPFRKSDGSDAVVVSYDFTNVKLLAIWGNAGTASAMPEVTDTTDLSAYSGRVTFIGYSRVAPSESR